MAKKKKNAVANETISVSKRNEPAQSPPAEFAIMSSMELTLLNVPKGKEMDRPLVLLCNQDANNLDVFNDDQVFVLVHKERVLLKLAICSVKIASTLNETPIKFSPIRSSPRPLKQQITRGFCHVVPPSLLERLCSMPENRNNTVTSLVTDNQKPGNTTSNLSNDRKTFSFNKGGGGDFLISSPSTKTPSEAAQYPSQKVVKQTVWVIPIFNNLGSRLLSILCKPCISISLQPLSTIPPNAVRVVQKLATARIRNEYIVEGETIGISFQGKLLKLHVESINVGTLDKVASIQTALNELSLDNVEVDNLGHHISSAVERAMVAPSTGEKLQLFQVQTSTEILIQSDSDLKTSSSIKGPFVAGLDDAIGKVMAVMIPALLRPESYAGLKPPRGVLLFGPGGVGKSAMTRQIASDVEIQYPQIRVDWVHCSSIQSRTLVVGEAERFLSKKFEHSEKTLLILDDIHFICPRRGSSGSNANIDRLTATLLALLDGIEQNNNVFLIATTADPSQLDPALRRPGRLDDEVEIPIPDEKTRAQIWKFHIDRLRTDGMTIDVSSEHDLISLASLAKGYTGADCHLALKEATRLALSDQATLPPTVTMDVLRAAIGITKPSTISSITVEVPKVFWSSIGGMVDVKEKLREAIELPLTHAELFAKYKIPPPRGVLLYGPPGCSKTLMARALATEGKMNFLAVKGPELLSKWLGESERALASLFRRARMASPCIIFFDEIDAIATKRGGSSGNAGGERLLSQLLTELDGVGSSRQQSHVVVVAATNRPDLLDHALTRPGRIDRKIYVGLPDLSSREQIFEIALKNKSHAEDINYHELAADELSGGFSGAEIVSICREAAMLALEEDDQEMTNDKALMIRMQHLLKAIQSTPRQITQSMLDFYAEYSKSL